MVVASWCPWLSSPVATRILDPQHLSKHTGQSYPIYLQASSAHPVLVTTVRMKLSLPSVSRLGPGRWTETQGG